jgi:hypothetical protein
MSKAWIDQIFEADAVDKGDVVRRKVEDVRKNASLEDLLAEVKLRNFHLIETGDQYIVVCNSGVLKIHA